MGADVCLFSPSTLMPSGIENFGAKICSSREEALDGANVVMGLRLQLERMKGGLFPSVAEYHEFYGINDKHVFKLAQPIVFALLTITLSFSTEYIPLSTSSKKKSVFKKFSLIALTGIL